MIKNKLKSENGASIFFALLLFLVCIVVSTIVITAATVASGRLADLAKMDQKYYLVNSVSDLIKNDLSENTVVLEVDKIENGSNVSYTWLIKDIDAPENAPEVSNSLIKESTLKLFNLNEGINITANEYNNIKPVENFLPDYNSNPVNSYDVVLSYDEGKTLNALITAYIEQVNTPRKDYSLIVKISDTDSEGKYSLITKYSADISNYEYVKEEIKPGYSGVIKHNIKAFNVKWNLSSIQKG